MGSGRRFETIDEYIDTFSKKTRSHLGTVRRIICKTVPEAEETISYQIPAFRLNGRILAYFAAFKNHISIYPFSAAMGKSMKETLKYKTSGKGTIQFALDKPLPLHLIQKIVKYRVKETLEREKAKKKGKDKENSRRQS